MKKTTIKDFDQFLVEANLKKSKGLPSDFLSSAEEEARKNLGVVPNRPGQSSLGELMAMSNQIMNGLSKEKFSELEQLAKDVIMDEFGFVLDASAKPVELDIRLVKSVFAEMPDLGKKSEVSAETPRYEEGQEEEEGQEAQEDTYDEFGQEDASDEDSQGQAQPQQEEEDDFFSFFDDETTPEEEESEVEAQEETQPEEEEVVSNREVALAIDKKKLLNLITQGAGKATKDIIKLSDTVREGLKRILGEDKWRSALDIWGRLSDEADKNDWTTPIGQKQAMFKNAPQGIAGAVRVNWESLSNDMEDLRLLTEDTDYNKIIIRAYAVDFPMLIHEATKGVYMLLQSAAIKKDPELAREIKRAVSSYRDEAEEFRYGPLANMMFATFVNNCAGAARFPNAKERIFGALALDKGRGGKFTDEEFLAIVKEIFSSFDKVEGAGKIKFVINREKFDSSKAKREIDEMIRKSNDEWEEYEEAVRAWEMEQRFGGEEGQQEREEEEESDIDKLVKQTLYGDGEETGEEPSGDKDYADMTQAEINQAISRAVEDEDYELAAMLRDTYLKKESRHIWDKEIKMLLERKRYRLRRP